MAGRQRAHARMRGQAGAVLGGGGSLQAHSVLACRLGGAATRRFPESGARRLRRQDDSTPNPGRRGAAAAWQHFGGRSGGLRGGAARQPALRCLGRVPTCLCCGPPCQAAAGSVLTPPDLMNCKWLCLLLWSLLPGVRSSLGACKAPEPATRSIRLRFLRSAKDMMPTRHGARAAPACAVLAVPCSALRPSARPILLRWGSPLVHASAASSGGRSAVCGAAGAARVPPDSWEAQPWLR